MDQLEQDALSYHAEHQGKLGVVSLTPLSTKDDLSLAYTPGVAVPCLKIADDVNLAYEYTSKGRMVAVVSDGSAVLGLGNIGPEASLPVMEGKCLLFKHFGDVDAVPICLSTQDPDEIIETVVRIAPTYGGINLEDIAAPHCFYIEEELKKRLSIPIFHDDQHGTAIVCLAGLINACKVSGKNMKDLSVVMIGSGAAGVAVCKLLMTYGVSNIVLIDSKGIVSKNRDDLNPVKMQLAEITNPENRDGSLEDALTGADVVIGVSRAGLLTQDMIRSMAADPIIFALANPVPEILPEEAKEAGASVIATGRSDFPNQINNVLAFPGIFKGIFSVRASEITDEMKIAAAEALANCVEKPTADCIIPPPFQDGVADKVADAVAACAKKA